MKLSPEQAIPGPPGMTATYRLQMNANFTFADASRHVDYFRELGISHLYLSPIWQALPGSQHGYDVIDHARISEELGGLERFNAFSRAAHKAGLKVIADIVPNHVAIAGHPWWRDVLRFGRDSRYAPYFDIDWSGRADLPPGCVLLPVLSQPLDHAIESCQLTIRLAGGEPVVEYQRQTFPLSPASHADAIAVLEAQRLQQSAPLESVQRLLAKQHYRLGEWRRASGEINYRRFFDVNGLAGLRMEHRQAFEDTHRLVAELTAEGHIDGLRVDHVDGLYDPAAYLRDLSELCPGVPIWVEKILAEDESLPPWAVEGTTGYDFPAATETLFHDPAGHELLLMSYRKFTGQREDFAAIAFESRRKVARDSFDRDIRTLAEAFQREAERTPATGAITVAELHEATLSLLACFPRYRTYADSAGASKEDRSVVREAASVVEARASGVSDAALAFVVEVLTEPVGEVDDPMRRARRDLISHFQQLCSPIMAKGIEDTAFYRYTALLCQNEVGGKPSAAPGAPEQIHAWLASRMNQPFTLNATSTHDTKRSEDARMRLAVLTEIPGEWDAALDSWVRLNSGARNVIAGETFPTPQSEHYLYQSLVASWDGSGGPGYVERVVTHMRKASREAKLWTSWLEPDERREAALEVFIRTVLEAASGAEFRTQLAAFVERIGPAAESNSLALLALKCLAPGVPDFYQGAEDWLYTLTDPDNRRPVDFGALGERLRKGPRSAKSHMARELLRLRAAHAELFADGRYESVTVRGPLANHAFAFLRRHGEERIAVLVRRRVAGLLVSGANSRETFAREGSIQLPADSWFDWMDSGRPIDGADAQGLLAERPVVVLTSFERPPA